MKRVGGKNSLNLGGKRRKKVWRKQGKDVARAKYSRKVKKDKMKKDMFKHTTKKRGTGELFW